MSAKGQPIEELTVAQGQFGHKILDPGESVTAEISWVVAVNADCVFGASTAVSAGDSPATRTADRAVPWRAPFTTVENDATSTGVLLCYYSEAPA